MMPAETRKGLMPVLPRGLSRSIWQRSCPKRSLLGQALPQPGRAPLLLFLANARLHKEPHGMRDRHRPWEQLEARGEDGLQPSLSKKNGLKMHLASVRNVL